MTTAPAFSLLTICGLDELPDHAARSVTHVLSILDPDWPDPEAFRRYDPHHRTVLRFHDAIEAAPGVILPGRSDVEAILALSRPLPGGADVEGAGHLLVHCHMGISRSTAAMTALLAQADPGRSEDAIFDRLLEIRPQAWPNSRMVAFADDLLSRKGRLTAALGRLYGRQIATFPRFAEEMKRLGRAREVAMAE